MTTPAAAATEAGCAVPPPARESSDAPFYAALLVLGGSYLLLILAMLVADCFYTSPVHLVRALRSEEIRYAIKLSLISCTVAMLLSLAVAVPLGYLLSRFRFPGIEVIDAVLDIPIVLPPLVIGLSLLILFQTPIGRAIEHVTQRRMGLSLTYVVLPLALAGVLYLGLRLVAFATEHRPLAAWSIGIAGGAWFVVLVALLGTGLGPWLSSWTQEHFATPVTYAVPSVIIAQFSVAAAFAVRTMRVTFEQLSPRNEQVALTLGCSRAQAFWRVVLPEAWRGVLTAATLSWARSLGEFGPILVFAGATRMRTEVLSTTVFLELSVGNLEAAIAVSLLMIFAAVVVLVIVRVFGSDRAMWRAAA